MLSNRDSSLTQNIESTNFLKFASKIPSPARQARVRGG